jgi:hypothetical protein
MFMKFLSLLMIICSGSFALARPAASLEELFARRVITLDRPLMTFNYYESDKDAASKEIALKGALKRIALFEALDKEPDQGVNAAGPGLYVAVDPAASRGFGRAHPQLSVITLKKGTRILDARKQRWDQLDSGYDEIRARLQCSGADYKSLNRAYETFRDSSSKRCAEETVATLKKLNIAAILYSYVGSDSLQGCGRSRDVALNIISPHAFGIQDFNVYGGTSGSGTSKMTSFVAQLTRESMFSKALGLEFEKPEFKTLPRSLESAQALSKEEYAKIKSELVWKCGPARDGTALPGDAIEEDFHKNWEEFRLKELSSKFSEAYEKKLQKRSLEIAELRGLLRQRYRGSRMAGDDSKFDQWLAARKIVMNREIDLFEGINLERFNQTMAKLAVLLEETPAQMTADKFKKLEKMFYQDARFREKDVRTRYIGLMPELLLKIGYGRRVAELFTELSGPLPMVAQYLPLGDRDYAMLVQQNREYIEKVLKHCIEEYNDPAQSAADIESGACGMVR